MKYLVVSDNHGDRQILDTLVTKYEGEVDYFFHCGDSELAHEDTLWQHFRTVKGNCDYYGDYPIEQVIQTGLDTVLITHGHLSDVRFGITKLGLLAQQADANIVLFGHTHQIGCEKVGNRLYLNPGSISQPRGPIQIQSFAIIESDESSYQVQYYDRQFKPVPDLNFHFKK